MLYSICLILGLEKMRLQRLMEILFGRKLAKTRKKVGLTFVVEIQMTQLMHCNIFYYFRPIDTVVPHLNSNVTITFGSTLKSDPCDASFGIDDVMIYVK